MKRVALIFSLLMLAEPARAFTRVGWRGNSTCVGECREPSLHFAMAQVMKQKSEFWAKCAEEHECPKAVKSQSASSCSGGEAGGYPCNGIDLLSFVSLDDQGSLGDGNDIWGWTDPSDGREYALACHYSGTTFVDITSPTDPIVLGVLPTHTSASAWRDVKVYRNYAFIVSEARYHGMQVFDLTRLRPSNRPARAPGAPVPQFTESAFYGEFGNCHNIVINEDSGYAFGVGSNTCLGGLHMINIADPLQPQFAGCFSDDAYVHDAQCVIYQGPDSEFTEHEICFCYNEDTLTIVDVSDKNKPKQLSRTGYGGYQYTHQGWLTADSKYVFMNDELDEMYNSNHHTRTMVWDVQSLTAPELKTSFYSELEVVDHNLYVHQGLIYLANYCGGLRVYSFDETTEELSEVASFDVAPDCDTVQFLGSWSSYPFFSSGNVIVQSIDRGLFVVRLQDSVRPQQ